MEELAKLLGATNEKLESLTEDMAEFTGKKEVPEQLMQKVEAERKEALSELGLSESSSRDEVLDVLKEKVTATEKGLTELLGEVDCTTQEGCAPLINKAVSIVKPQEGFFLKEDKARELLLANPPRNVMDVLGYKSAEEMVGKEDVYELFASLRFVEDRKWLNEVFFTPYEKLTPDDFEKRTIQIKVLEADKWARAAAAFMKKKFHNVSHLKELGIVFTIPASVKDGATLRLFSLLFHYLHEVPFYAQHFALAAEKNPKEFAKIVVADLRGDVRESIPLVENVVTWMIIQRYLYKEDPADSRLGIPHVSPESMHWKRAADDIASFGKDNPQLGLDFWAGKAHIAGSFGNKLTSFNFEDNVFSAVPGQEVEQYTYHMREALWNKFFTEWFEGGEKVLETLLVEDFSQGFVGFKIRNTESGSSP